MTVLCVLSLAGATAFAQEVSLGELARRARQAKQAQPQTFAAAPAQTSLADQARRALQHQNQPAAADASSLGEQARRLRAEKAPAMTMAFLPLRRAQHFDIAVAAPEVLPVVVAHAPEAPQPQTAVATMPVQPIVVAQAPPQPQAQPVVVASQPQPAAVAPPQVAAAPQSSPSVQPGQVVAAPVESGNSTVSTGPPPPQDSAVAGAVNVQTEFKIKYVSEDVVYLSSGRSAGLAEGMKLTIRRAAMDANGAANDVAQLEVVSVAATSAVCEIKHASGEIRAGDFAYLGESDAETLAQSRALGSGRKYPQVVTFSEGDPLDEEAREEVPRPPLPEINRARGRIGIDYSGINSRGSTTSSSYQLGGVVRADITRIAGTYWNLSGYWRGRFNNSSFAGQTTLQDLINRTYHLSLTYDSPTSRWVAGFGRLYLPWASSLDTLDGGYIGRKLGRHVTAGLFAGSTPDPTSWDYNPNRRTAGSFLAYEGGSYDSVRFTSTSGMAVTSIGWVMDRPFVFFENGIFFKRYLSIYQSAQADDPRPAPGMTRAGAGLSRSYVTVRFQPVRWLAFDLNHNYFRDVPTFDQTLISTGLLDKYLFQGLSAGVRVEPIRHLALYTEVGRSSRTGDAKNSGNQMYGVTWDRLWKTGLRIDVRASKFDGTFGSGTYRSIAVSRNLGDRIHWQVQAGRQNLDSSLSSEGASKFVNGSMDAAFGGHYFVQADYTTQRGLMLDYDQWIFTFGYRFDNRTKTAGGVQ